MAKKTKKWIDGLLEKGLIRGQGEPVGTKVRALGQADFVYSDGVPADMFGAREQIKASKTKTIALRVEPVAMMGELTSSVRRFLSRQEDGLFVYDHEEPDEDGNLLVVARFLEKTCHPQGSSGVPVAAFVAQQMTMVKGRRVR